MLAEVGNRIDLQIDPVTPIESKSVGKCSSRTRRTPIAHSAKHGRTLLSVLGTVILFFVSASGAGAQDRKAVSTSGDSGIVRLPVIDQQDIRFKRLSTADGLSQTRVITMVEDDQGFIWFGTQYGLNRYDGHKFKLFKHDPGRPDSLSGVFVLSLFKDRSGTLWVGGEVPGPVRPEHRDIYSLPSRSRRSESAGNCRHPHQPGSRGDVVAGNPKRSAQIGSRNGQGSSAMVMIQTIPPA